MVVEAGIDGNAVQPGVEGRVWSKVFESLKCLDECVLRRIMGIIRIDKHMAAQVIDPVLVFPRKCAERRTIARLKCCQQPIVFVHY